MNKFKEFIGAETYEILFSHTDQYGSSIEDMEDVVYCEVEDISESKVKKLQSLLTYDTDLKSIYVSLEASKILSAWGVCEGIEYFQFFINNELYKVGVISAHRLYTNVDDTFSKLVWACSCFIARLKDDYPGRLEYSKPLVEKLVISVFKLLKNVSMDIDLIFGIDDTVNWYSYKKELVEMRDYLESLPDNNFNKRCNLQSINSLLTRLN